jgi:hypothetical protein
MLTPDFYIGALDKVIEKVRGTIGAYVNRRDSKQEQHWDVLMAAVDTLKKLVLQHFEAIKFVSDPLLEHNDLVGTAKNLRTLVYNDDFPMGYDLLRGKIKHCSQMKAFSEAARSLMLELLQRLRAFQLEAFMIDPHAWKKGDLPSVLVLYAFDHALTLLPLLEKQEKSANDIKTINELGSWISGQFAGTPEVYRDPSAGPVFENPEQLVALAKAWCRSWVQQVRVPLILGDGVMSKIGALEAQRPTG